MPTVLGAQAAKAAMDTLNRKRLFNIALISLLLLALPSAVVGQEADKAAEGTENAAGDDTAAATENAAAQKADSAPSKVPPLYLAAKSGNIGAVRSLIAEGMDVNAANAAGRSALMSAVFFRNRGIVRELLTEGANVNAVDAQGRSALMIAVVNKDINMVEILLGAGADVALEDKSKNTAMTLAEKSKNKSLLKLLEESAG